MFQNFADSNEEAVLKTLLKRRNIYTIVTAVCLVVGGVCGIIPAIGWYLSIAMIVVEGIAAGLGMLCINQYRYFKSGGKKQGGGLWWFLLFLFGFIIMPLITVVICSRVKPLAEVIMGIKFI